MVELPENAGTVITCRHVGGQGRGFTEAVSYRVKPW